MIIHISGPSGSGKTTLGKEIKKVFKNKIIVNDLDDLRNEFKEINKIWDEKKYQKYLDDYINKIKKPLVLVGINDNING